MFYNIKSMGAIARVKKKSYLCMLILVWSRLKVRGVALLKVEWLCNLINFFSEYDFNSRFGFNENPLVLNGSEWPL